MEADTLADRTSRINTTINLFQLSYRAISGSESEDAEEAAEEAAAEEGEEEEVKVDDMEVRWLKEQTGLYEWYSLRFTSDCSAACGAAAATNKLQCRNNHVLCQFCSGLMDDDRYSSFLII
jgi:hypothetical protein